MFKENNQTSSRSKNIDYEIKAMQMRKRHKTLENQMDQNMIDTVNKKSELKKKYLLSVRKKRSSNPSINK